MNPETIVFALVTFLHDLVTVTWIGGLIVFGITVMPTIKKTLGAGPQTKQLMAVLQKRHSTFVYISIAGLLLTGLLMSRRSPGYGGLFSFTTPYSIALSLKHILVLGMIGIALYRSLVLGCKGGPATPEHSILNARLLIINIILGVAVLLTSGFVAALST